MGSEPAVADNRRGRFLAILFLALLLVALVYPVTLETASSRSGGTRFELVRVPTGEAAKDCAIKPSDDLATISFARGATSYRFVPATNVMCGQDAAGQLIEAYRMGRASGRETQFVLERSHVVRRLDEPSTWLSRPHVHFASEGRLELDKKREEAGE
jgi:hypothetical protein